MAEDRRSTTTGRHALRTFPDNLDDRLPVPDPEDPVPTQRTLVRPYVLTRGRTQSRRHLAIDALVSTRAGSHWNGARLTGEVRSVRTLCHHPRSVAEVAARSEEHTSELQSPDQLVC